MEERTLPNRKSLRLNGYDYTQHGAYYITICTQERSCLFGEIVNGKMHLNDTGRMVKHVWEEMAKYYEGIVIENKSFIIMPNHIHGVIILENENVGAGPCACPFNKKICPSYTEKKLSNKINCTNNKINHNNNLRATTGGRPYKKMSLSDIVHRFKTLTTRKYIKGYLQKKWPSYHKRLWQRGYHDRIIRNRFEHREIIKYISNNPGNWEQDRENILK